MYSRCRLCYCYQFIQIRYWNVCFGINQVCLWRHLAAVTPDRWWKQKFCITYREPNRNLEVRYQKKFPYNHLHNLPTMPTEQRITSNATFLSINWSLPTEVQHQRCVLCNNETRLCSFDTRLIHFASLIYISISWYQHWLTLSQRLSENFVCSIIHCLIDTHHISSFIVIQIFFGIFRGSFIYLSTRFHVSELSWNSVFWVFPVSYIL